MVPGLLLALPAMAQTNVYKCTEGAHPVYQQTPCQGRAEWRWEVPAEDAAARAAPSAAAAPAPPRTPRRPARGHAQGAMIPLAADPAGCERARRRQVTALAGTRRLDYLQRRQLDDAVRAACR